MRKTYKSKAAQLRLVAEVYGERVGIEFGWDIVSAGGAMGCSYSTDDAAIQEAIEGNELFGSRIWCENDERRTMNDEQQSVASVSPAYDAQLSADGASASPAAMSPATIESIAEARKVLREQYGKSAGEVKTKVQVLALLNELGLEYSIND